MSGGGHEGSSFVARKFVVGQFATTDALLDGTKQVRARGHKNLDTHTPYPVHGLEEALGLKRPKIPTIVLKVIGMCVGGLCGGRLPMFIGQSKTLQK
jgi:hypothetical protein